MRRHRWEATHRPGRESRCGHCALLRRYMRSESAAANFRTGTISVRISDVAVYARPGKPWEPSKRVPPCKGGGS